MWFLCKRHDCLRCESEHYPWAIISLYLNNRTDLFYDGALLGGSAFVAAVYVNGVSLFVDRLLCSKALVSLAVVAVSHHLPLSIAFRIKP